MNHNLTIIKVGGKLLEHTSSKQEILTHFSKIKGPKILVHGGGAMATEIADQLGIPTLMVEGRRVTDEETLKVATMVYAGLVNKTLVAKLQSLGCNAIGLCGADLNLIRAKKRKPGAIDFGWVGDITEVDTGNLKGLLTAGFVPVLCALTHDGKGQLLNTNADTIAAEIASAMSPYFQTSLKLCLDKAGVLESPQNDATVIPQLNNSDFLEMQQNGSVHAGMIPKLQNGFMALHNQVHEVIICGVAELEPKTTSKGTTLCLI